MNAPMRIANTNSRMKVDTSMLADRSSNEDFRDLVMTKLKGWLADPQNRPLGDQILVATYVQPRRTAGGILLPDKSVDEDRWQGKVGLLLKKGSNAFKFINGGYKYPEEDVPEIGDYVVYSTSDTREIGVLGLSCRYVDYWLVRGTVSDPGSIY